MGSSGSGEALTSERLAAIREFVGDIIMIGELGPHNVEHDYLRDLLAEVARLRAILAHAWTDAIKHDSGCGCYTCELAREAITRDDAERILWPVE